MPKIAILAIGDELLNGSLSDTNSATIANLIARDGFTIRQIRLVRDVIEEIADAVRQLSREHDVLITTGGLGPTDDDMTAVAVATACDTETELNQDALQMVDDFFERLGRPKHQRNLKSATLPKGATPLENRCGTAPGFYLQHQNCHLFSMPGVPDEMREMTRSAVLPKLVSLFGRPLHQPERILTLAGIPEPMVEEQLLAAGLPEGIDLGFGIEFPLVLVKLRCDRPDAAELLDRAEAMIETLFAGSIVARGDETLASATAALLIDKQKTLSLAESCTGGLIGKMLTDIAGASSFLDRGAITYSNRSKSDWLGVPETILETAGAVSAATAEAMAKRIRSAAGTDFGLSVTGIAGPDGGTDDKPVGTVFIALSDKDDTIVEHHIFAGNRERVRMRTACTALTLLQKRLCNG